MENENLIKMVTEKAQGWLADGYDEETRAEVRRMLDADDKTELIDSFYRDLEFGTGGLRGIMGAGTNRMNIYTVGAATQGLANYLKVAFKDEPQISVVVGHDVRNNSRKFAEIVADIFSANGIKVYLFDSFRPTPELSFAIRELGCQSGVNITASHNPKEYNGYKAYWSDGAQFIAPHDVNVIEYVNRISGIGEIKFKGNPELITIIGDEMDQKFLAAIKGLQLSPEAVKQFHDLKLVYTPIHGTGVKLIPDSLRNYGFTNIINVPEQDVTSGDFPTVASPNPEVPSAMAMAIAKAKEVDADLILASDPDADRIGCVLRDDNGEYVLINGNQIVMILLNYIMTRNKELGRITGNEYIVKTIVTTETIKSIADKNGFKMYDCYTGFKWIAAVIRENEGTGRYLGGGEESYGFLAEDFCRDKDAVSAISLMAEALAWAKTKNMNFLQMLKDIYMTYGFSREAGISLVRKGKTGAEEIIAIMKNFRANPPKQLAGSPIVTIKDYADLNLTDVTTGNVSKMDMPVTSNVLQYFTADGTKVSVRPSGTEPKIKFYVEVRGKMEKPEDYGKAIEEADAKIEAIKKDLGID
ncbi:phospho-sugar mutase [Muribaculum intestinale]|mgnify:FL=1|jgi:phosphoglucomutase|uniref:Phospho-sugar mutase n=1 Tax=Muribaculum intestinale TaxID=1796646 RepID=A0A1B1SA51_9BACT|nr:phospho-sugar mutase [Muribaculum intestinale]ROS81121.1 phospho-sugar mutase [Muribaculaceae bacterium Isolate-042 (Harlan)]ROT05766.1 phospho-sugar mutase [Muribaculaceae bacterium Isolate-100 (HZI)]RXE64828.1 phospho-sugar mutase [Muribaculaceae bacterium Isolate-007 (NCI)]GFI67802.1 phosphoglucomutase [Muribaculaceae bacterium]ANU63683.1 phosphoglucomutase [Muribaculum intestinale]